MLHLGGGGGATKKIMLHFEGGGGGGGGLQSPVKYRYDESRNENLDREKVCGNARH